MAKPKETIPFEDFLAAVPPAALPAVERLDAQMRKAGCEVGIEPAKSGYVASYRYAPSGRVLANFVFRKKGPVIRLYADNILRYMEFLEGLPKAMRDKVAKAPVCRRLVNPTLCNPNCAKGYEFVLAGEPYQKCRYNAFLFFIDAESAPFIEEMLAKELAGRTN